MVRGFSVKRGAYSFTAPALLLVIVLGLAAPIRAEGPAEGTKAAGENVPVSAILFIADGMGLAQVTAARVYRRNARDGKLALDSFPHTALVRTYAADKAVTDSAAAATALATGFKTNNAMIGRTPDGMRLVTLLERAKARGKSVGVVTTTRVTHATPAAFFAHVEHRDLESEIARQLIDEADVDLIMGGGRRFFIPSSTRDEEEGTPGASVEERQLLSEACSKGYRLVQSRSEMEELARKLVGESTGGPVLGLFSASHMAYEAERLADAWGEPSLAEMTRFAVDYLGRNPNGYFLMVEGGRIDHACHTNHARLALEDLLAFDDAVAEGLREAERPGGPLVVVTADHETGGLALNGDPGIEAGGTALFTTGSEAGPDILTFATGPGARRQATGSAHQADWGYQPAALNHLDSAAHTGVDVGLWAAGSGGHFFDGTLDNTDVAVILQRQLGLD